MSEPSDKEQGKSQPPHGDLASELRELGQQIEQAVRGALASDQARNIQRDISAGMREIGTQLQHALSTIKEDPRVQNLAERGQQAINQARESPATKDFQEALARGVAQLNEQLANFINRTQSSSAGDDSSAGSADPKVTNVPIEHDDPATGETTRLDPDKKD